MVLGALMLGGVFIEGRDSTDHIHIIAVAILALAVTLTLGGLQTIRWGFEAARAREREAMFTQDLFSIENGQAVVIDEIREFITAEKTQAGRSAEARERLERMERVLLVLSAASEGAAEIGHRLTAIEQGMTVMARAIQEVGERHSGEASRVEVRLDSLAKQLGNALAMLGKMSLDLPARAEIVEEVRTQLADEVATEVKKARNAGYVDGVRGRLGGGGELRVLRGGDD